MHFTVGIDPGLSGGIAIIGGFFDVTCPIPVLTERVLSKKSKTGFKNKTRYDAAKIRDLLASVATDAVVVIEKQQPMRARDPNYQDETGQDRIIPQGQLTSLNLGYGMGLLEGIAVGLGLRVEYVHVRTWQSLIFGKERRGNSPDRKGRSIREAQRIFPDVGLLPTPRSKKPHDGMADALLIAKYGQMVYA